MKNVLLTIILFGGFFISQLNAQSCVPSPLCPPGCYVASCCKSAGAAAASANTDSSQTGQVQIMPVALEVFNTCTPEQLAACKASGMSDKELKACQKACTSKSAQACAPKASVSCTPASTATTQPNEATIDHKYHKTPKPTKS